MICFYYPCLLGTACYVLNFTQNNSNLIVIVCATTNQQEKLNTFSLTFTWLSAIPDYIYTSGDVIQNSRLNPAISRGTEPLSYINTIRVTDPQWFRQSCTDINTEFHTWQFSILLGYSFHYDIINSFCLLVGGDHTVFVISSEISMHIYD